MAGLKVGMSVRVWAPDKKTSRVGILAVDNEDDTFDLIYGYGMISKLSEYQGEEENVPIERILFLEDFELIPPGTDKAGPGLLKERGNKLYSEYKDYGAASVCYMRALTLVVPTNLQIGQHVLVAQKSSLEFASGIVADIVINAKGEAHQYEVIYDDSRLFEEHSIAASRVLGLSSPGPQGRQLQRSLYLNLARTSLQRENFGWASRWASLGLAVSKVWDGNFHISSWNTITQQTGSTESHQKLMADCYYLRSRALVSVGRPNLARADAFALREIDPERAATLLKSVEAFKAQRAKTNKKLARDVAAWVDQAMQIHAAIPQGARQGGGVDLNFGFGPAEEGAGGGGGGGEMVQTNSATDDDDTEDADAQMAKARGESVFAYGMGPGGGGGGRVSGGGGGGSGGGGGGGKPAGEKKTAHQHKKLAQTEGEEATTTTNEEGAACAIQ